ncbi:MAG TPA: lipocalin-like domain-containing protein [Thermoanaerobaculia bacterium]|nr:lipocalin-like domain-containing protein [Thermoanaerobaculia bacterium]
MKAITLALVLTSSFILHPSSFAQFKLAVPPYDFQFPRDHGSHDAYQTEWWYFTGHLRGESGRRYGFELTFFRVGVTPPETAPATPWDLRHLALAHFAITDIDGREFRYHEKLNRVSPFTAGAATGHLDVFNEGWRATTAADGSWRVQASAEGDAIDLTLRSAKPPAIHGENGVSVKAAGEGYASHYYSMTRLLVTGTVAAKGRKRERCDGLAWMDHEFGSSQLREYQQGWDWFSVQLDNETELMLYVIRRADGTPDVTSSGSFVTDTGRVIHIGHRQMQVRPEGSWRSPGSGATYPMGWTLAVPSLRIVLRLRPVLEDQELVTSASTQVTYWEGAVEVTGSSGDISVRGAGYVEMTGYDRVFRQP